MEKGLTKLNDVKVFYPLSNYFIVEIKNLPKDYKALKINFKLLDKEDENVSSNSKEMSQYTSAEKNNRDYNLQPKTKSEYYVDAFQLRLKELDSKYKNTEKEIKKLSEDSKNLDNPELIEKYAREKLGMVKPNEVLIKDEKEKPKKDTNFTPSPTFDKKPDK